MVFNWKKSKEDKPADVKTLRDMLVRLLKDELQKFEGGEGSNIHDIQLFINCSDEERPLYDAAIYQNEDGRFKQEIQKVADDYAIDLPENWLLNMVFTDDLPIKATKNAANNIGVIINTNQAVKPQATITSSNAEIKVLTGDTQQAVYHISPKSGKINIGRGEEVVIADGSTRINHIAFTAETADAANKFVSRSHAHIEWNAAANCFMIYADAGGIPPGNKTKIKSAADGQVHKLGVTDIGYRLAGGDQIILGESAVLQIL